MLYCYDSVNHAKFIEMERQILAIRLGRMHSKEERLRVKFMGLLKRMLSFFLGRGAEEFQVELEIVNLKLVKSMQDFYSHVYKIKNLLDCL